MGSDMVRKGKEEVKEKKWKVLLWGAPHIALSPTPLPRYGGGEGGGGECKALLQMSSIFTLLCIGRIIES
jgi:hypothetical protein